MRRRRQLLVLWITRRIRGSTLYIHCIPGPILFYSISFLSYSIPFRSMIALCYHSADRIRKLRNSQWDTHQPSCECKRLLVISLRMAIAIRKNFFFFSFFFSSPRLCSPVIKSKRSRLPRAFQREKAQVSLLSLSWLVFSIRRFKAGNQEWKKINAPRHDNVFRFVPS